MERFSYSRCLPYDTVCKIIDECAELGIPSMLFSWRGESFLYHAKVNNEVKNIADVFAYARKKGILEITYLTNGQEMNERLIRAIVDAEPNWLSFFIDGLGSNYNKIRTPKKYKAKPDFNAFNAVVENIKKLVAFRDEAGKTRPQIRTNTIFPAIAPDPQAYHDFIRRTYTNTTFSIVHSTSKPVFIYGTALHR